MLIGAAAVLALVSIWTSRSPDLYQSVVTEWNENISRLGIEPVYPPQEDVVVGDIYFVITKDRAKSDERLPSSLPGRSIKFEHIDVSEEIVGSLKKSYRFPDTTTRPTSDGDIWRQQAASDSIFTSDKEKATLPLVLFPGISIARTREASGGFAGIFQSIAASVGLSRAEQRSIELKIPAAETYGIGSLAASRRLARFCSEPATRRSCTDRAVRNQLSMVVGSEIFRQIEGSSDFRFDVEIMLISRVYMIRAIDSVSDSRSSTDANIKAGGDENERLREVRELETELSNLAQAQRAAASDLPKEAVMEQAARVQRIGERVARRATQISVRSTEGRRVVATQTLERPVVIGFRAVRTAPF